MKKRGIHKDSASCLPYLQLGCSKSIFSGSSRPPGNPASRDFLDFLDFRALIQTSSKLYTLNSESYVHAKMHIDIVVQWYMVLVHFQVGIVHSGSEIETSVA